MGSVAKLLLDQSTEDVDNDQRKVFKIILLLVTISAI